MGLAFEAINPDIFPVALELFRSGMDRFHIAGRIYKQFGKKWGVPENELHTAMIDLSISEAESCFESNRFGLTNQGEMEIIEIINKLKQKRKIFFSESDFQFALAWEIQKYYNNANIRLEYCPHQHMNLYIDIIVELNNKVYPIELKYKTKTFIGKDGNEKYNLKNQGAQDIGRYDYLKDIQRIEQFSKYIENYEYGFAILLTNDESYWKKDRKGTVDEQFYLLENIIKTGKLKWGKNASEGTMKNRNDPIKLTGEYKIIWNEYSNFNENKNGEFKYCINKIML